MLSNDQLKLKSSLNDAIQNWIDEICKSSEWENGYGEYIGDYTSELMTDASFAVLMAVREIQIFIEKDE